jgi:hypothetical protein
MGLAAQNSTSRVSFINTLSLVSRDVSLYAILANLASERRAHACFANQDGCICLRQSVADLEHLTPAIPVGCFLAFPTALLGRLIR